MGNGKMADSFAEALIQLREMRQLGRSQLAYKSGLKRSTITMLELGERTDPRSSTLAKLAAALEVSTDDILIKAGMKEPAPTGNPGKLSPKEKEIVMTLRAIESPAFRRNTLDAILQFARGAQEASGE